TVVVEGQRITAVDTEGVPATADDAVFDLGGKTIMPGMVTGHYHVAYDHVHSPEEIDMKHSAGYTTLVAAKNAELTLRSGYTGAIGAACIHNIDATLKQAIADGLIIGPRLLASSRDLCTTAGPVDTRPDHWGPMPDGVARLCDGADEFRKAVRQEIKLGADVIKVHVTGGHGVQCDPEDVIMTDEELSAAVQTAHGLGRRIRGHVASKRGSSRLSPPGWTSSTTPTGWTRSASNASSPPAPSWCRAPTCSGSSSTAAARPGRCPRPCSTSWRPSTSGTVRRCCRRARPASSSSPATTTGPSSTTVTTRRNWSST